MNLFWVTKYCMIESWTDWLVGRSKDRKKDRTSFMDGP